MHSHHYTCLLVLFGVVAELTKKENADCKYDLFVETGYWPSGGTDNWVDFKFQILNRTSTGFSEKFSYPDNGWLTYEPTDDDNYYEPGKVERWSWNCSKLASFAITGIHVRLRKTSKQNDDWTMSGLWMQEKTGKKRYIEFAYTYQDFNVGDSHFFPVLNCVADQWSKWSACHGRNCTGEQNRTRVVKAQPSADCNGDETQTCNLAGAWEEWGECSASCGTGIRNRVRKSPVTNDICEKGKGDCVTATEWGAWTTCTVSCGGGKHYRYRTVSKGYEDKCKTKDIEVCGSEPC